MECVNYNINTNELSHHGVKGQHWGVRRYQYADGSLTPKGRQHYANSDNKKSLMKEKVSYAVNKGKTTITGRQYVDGYINKGTTLARIQTNKNFENFAFYATYKKSDQDKYLGLFGKNLKQRAERDAKNAEKKANVSGLDDDIFDARNKREYSDNMKIYQLKLESQKRLRIPSDENATDITMQLLKDKDFKKNLELSLNDTKEGMPRPTQQILIKQAQNALGKNPKSLTSSEKIALYKALNLSLVYHNPYEIALQDKFYGELKKKGYDALLDYNDKDYSSYHAKRPMIVFNTDAVKLQSVTEPNSKVIDKMYTKYNKERITKEIGANTYGLILKQSSKTVSDCYGYVKNKSKDYLYK